MILNQQQLYATPRLTSCRRLPISNNGAFICHVETILKIAHNFVFEIYICTKHLQSYKWSMFHVKFNSHEKI
jgi:hypothetical protein